MNVSGTSSSARELKLNLKKGDQVMVIAGAEKGKTGKISLIDKKHMRVTIDGVNMRTKHVKPTQKNPQGGLVPKEAAIHYSNVMILDSKGKPTRIGRKVVEKGGKRIVTRFAKTTGEELK